MSNVVDFLTGNLILNLSILAWAIAQVLKFVITLISQGKLDWRHILSSGGMPSSHSAFVCACAAAMGYMYGWASPVFTISAVVAIVVMYDAANVRKAAGEQAKIDHTAGNAAAGGELVRRAVLGTPEQDVSRGTPGDPGQKPPARRAEGQRDTALGAGAHQGGRGPGVGEGDNAAQGMERVAGGLLMFPAGDHIFAVQGQIDVLRGHEEGVQQLSHGVSSMARFR